MWSGIITRCELGAFWNPNGGMMVSDKKLLKNEVYSLKRKWSRQLHVSDRRLGMRWKRIKGAVVN